LGKKDELPMPLHLYSCVGVLVSVLKAKDYKIYTRQHTQ